MCASLGGSDASVNSSVVPEWDEMNLVMRFTLNKTIAQDIELCNYHSNKLLPNLSVTTQCQ